MLAASLSPLGIAALYYARLGWRVFPLGPRSKRPLLSRQQGGRGCHDATTDEAQIVAWWTAYPEANVGIATGGGLAVLDVDPRNGGAETLENFLTLHGVLPHTVAVQTGGGGWHYYFAGDVPCAVLGPGLELKGIGGYVVAAESIHPDGPPYVAEASSEPGEVPLAPLPAWCTAPPAEVVGDGPDAARSFLGAAFEAAGWLGKRYGQEGKRAVLCPWRHEHTTGRDYDTSTLLFTPRPGATMGCFACSHGHCHGRRWREALLALPLQARRAAEVAYPAPAREGGEKGEGEFSPGGVNPLDLWTASDMAGDPPSPSYLCRRIHLAPGRPFALTAYAGAGKTFLLADLALAVASGSSCWGGCEVQRSGTVVHLDLELGRASTWRRYRRLAAGRGFDVASLGDALRWRSFPKFRLTQANAFEVLCQVLQGVALCILDSLKALLPGVDENDSRIADYLEILARVSEATGCSIAVIHHEGKPPSDGARDARYRGRGSSAIQGWLGSQWSVSRDADSWTLEHGKSEHGREQEPIKLRLVDIGEPDEDGMSPAIRFAPVMATAIAPLAEIEALARRAAHVLGAQNVKSLDVIAKAARMTKRDVSVGIRHLLDTDRVVKNELGFYQLLGGTS